MLVFEIAGAAIRSRRLRVAGNPRGAKVALPQDRGRHPVSFGAGVSSTLNQRAGALLRRTSASLIVQQRGMSKGQYNAYFHDQGSNRGFGRSISGGGQADAIYCGSRCSHRSGRRHDYKGPEEAYSAQYFLGRAAASVGSCKDDAGSSQANSFDSLRINSSRDAMRVIMALVPPQPWPGASLFRASGLFWVGA